MFLIILKHAKKNLGIKKQALVPFLIFGIVIHFFHQRAEARVFDLGAESFSAYIKGTIGPAFTSGLHDDSSGTNISLDSQHKSVRSGEFGFIYSTLLTNIRVGLSVLVPESLQNQSGQNSSGTEVYSLNSELTVTSPTLALEFNFMRSPRSRGVFSLGLGYANLVARNAYTINSSGQSLFGITDFSEELRSTALMYEAGVGYEFLMTDTTTFIVEGGYRWLNFTEIKHNKAVTTFQGVVAKGDIAKNMDGTARSLNITSGYAGISFRIWID